MTKEDTLILLMKNKDEDAFELIYNKYSKLVYYVINNIVRDKEVAEELTSDTFVKMYNAIESFDEKRKFSSWLTTIARNSAINYVNRNKDNNLVFDEEIINKIENVEETIDAKDIIETVLDGIECEVVKLKIIEDYTYQKIGDMLGISVSEVFRKFNSGIQKIKNYIRK